MQGGYFLSIAPVFCLAAATAWRWLQLRLEGVIEVIVDTDLTLSLRRRSY